MAGYKCKKCSEKNTILKEWIDLGINRIVVCKACGHKMNLNLSIPTALPPNGTKVVEKTQHNYLLESEGGTQIDGISHATKNTYQFRIIKSDMHTKNLGFTVLKEAFTIYIGRNPAEKSPNFNTNTDIAWVINDPYASRAQCLINIVVQNSRVQFILKDLGSANGTKINNSSLEKGDQILLNLGDEIEIGDTIFTFENQ
jgi:DNA-directed RNA polymerase subunit RPC12/RpoP